MADFFVKNRLLVMNIFLLFAVVVISFTDNNWLKSFCSGAAVVITLLNVGEGINRYKNEKAQAVKKSI